MTTQTIDHLLQENDELRRRLEEAEEALRAIRVGAVDAVLVEAERAQVFTLESADKPYRLLVEQMPQGAATLTVEGAILYCNRRFTDLFKRPLQALLGKSMLAFVADASRPHLEALLRDGQAGDVQGEVTLQRADGTAVPVYLSVGVLREGALGLCLLITDLTEHRHYEELQRTQAALRASEEALKEADRRKDEFLAMLSHELRNPLAPIGTGIQVLNQIGVANPDAQRVRDMIGRQVGHMTRIIDDLLDLARIASGKIQVRPECCDLTAIARHTAEDYRRDLEAEGLTLSVQLPEQSLWVLGDRTRLAQILGNLLHNARKFTDAGGHVTVTLAAEPGGRAALLTVRDTGIGIEPAMLVKLFETFSQADRSRARSRGGLGLGLALVKGVVELHGGEVRAASAGPGRGSEFLIRLPLERAPAAPPEPTTPASASAPACRSYRILIVEDNRDAADSMKILLGLTGHQAEVAYSGTAGLETARQFLPEVVVCDIGLPGDMDGHALARAFRREPALAATYLIALSGYGQDEDQQRAREAGFNRHLTKPVAIDELQRLLASLPPQG